MGAGAAGNSGTQERLAVKAGKIALCRIARWLAMFRAHGQPRRIRASLTSLATSAITAIPASRNTPRRFSARAARFRNTGAPNFVNAASAQMACTIKMPFLQDIKTLQRMRWLIAFSPGRLIYGDEGTTRLSFTSTPSAASLRYADYRLRRAGLYSIAQSRPE